MKRISAGTQAEITELKWNRLTQMESRHTAPQMGNYMYSRKERISLASQSRPTRWTETTNAHRKKDAGKDGARMPGRQDDGARWLAKEANIAKGAKVADGHQTRASSVEVVAKESTHSGSVPWRR